MNWETRLARLTNAAVTVALWTAAGVMAILILGGLGVILTGIVELARHASTGESKAAVAKTLEGLELIFLAPTPLLVLLALRPYVAAVIARMDDAASHARLVEVKAFVVTLMVAVLATDLVKHAHAGTLGYEIALARCAAIVVLVAYFVVLERSLHVYGR